MKTVVNDKNDTNPGTVCSPSRALFGSQSSSSTQYIIVVCAIGALVATANSEATCLNLLRDGAHTK
jgi:hypothetical protein